MKKTFFTRDPSFYRSFFKLMTVIALQNLVAYSVNMLDNIMLGSYSQNALSGAATVNQIYFIVNQIALAIGNALIAISSQYWKPSDKTHPKGNKSRTVIQPGNCCRNCSFMYPNPGKTDWPLYDFTGYHKRRYYLPSYHTMDIFIFYDQ